MKDFGCSGMLGDDHLEKLLNNVNNLGIIFDDTHLPNSSIIIKEHNVGKGSMNEIEHGRASKHHYASSTHGMMK